MVLGMKGTLSRDYMPCTIAVSLQMSDEPRMIHQLEICSAAIIKLQVQAIQLTIEFEKRVKK